MPCLHPLNLREHEAGLTESHKPKQSGFRVDALSCMNGCAGSVRSEVLAYRIISYYSSIVFSKTEGAILRNLCSYWVFRLSKMYRAIAWYIQGPESMWMWLEDAVCLQILALRASTFIIKHTPECSLSFELDCCKHEYVTQSDLTGAILCWLGTLAVRDLKAYTWQRLQNAQLVPEC